ncbi:MAG: FAD-binding protein [Patescibacteria group bacterium]
MIDVGLELKKRLGDRLQENISLRDHNCFGVGGVADYFCVVSDIDSLAQVVGCARDLSVPHIVLGEGSSVVPSDSGFAGLVIKNKSSNVVFSVASSEVLVDSGISLANLVNLAASRDLGGLEFLAGMSGTIGGALYNNYSSSNFSIGDFVKSVTVLTEQGGKMMICSYPKSWMEFRPHSSRAKTSRGFHPVLLTVRLQLTRRRKDEILRILRDNYRARKNPQEGHALKQVFLEPESSLGLALGSVLAKVGARRFRVGGVSVCRQDQNSFINRNRATAGEVRTLADRLRCAVSEQCGFCLKERIEYIGRW